MKKGILVVTFLALLGWFPVFSLLPGDSNGGCGAKGGLFSPAPAQAGAAHNWSVKCGANGVAITEAEPDGEKYGVNVEKKCSSEMSVNVTAQDGTLIEDQGKSIKVPGDHMGTKFGVLKVGKGEHISVTCHGDGNGCSGTLEKIGPLSAVDQAQGRIKSQVPPNTLPR